MNVLTVSYHGKCCLAAGVALTVPDGAVRKGCTQIIFIAVLRDDRDRPKLTGEYSNYIITCDCIKSIEKIV